MSDRVVTGRRFVIEALRAGTVRTVHIERGLRPKLSDLVAEAERADVTITEVDRAKLDALSKDVRHQGVVGVGPPYRFYDLEDLLSEAPLLVALDEITDPHNLGAIVRSAVAFATDGVIVPQHRSATVTPVVVRASAGATEHARIAQVTNLQRSLQLLSKQGLQIVGLDADGEVSLDALEPAPLGRVVVIGSEGKGLRRLVRSRCDILARIPQLGPVASLNASVAAGIALYEASRRR